MKRFLISSMAVVVMITAFQLATAPSALALKLGAPVPDFTLPDVAGRPVCPLAVNKGKVVLLNFWSTTCGPCLAEIPALNAIYRELKAKGVVVVGVAVDRSLEAVAAQMTKSNIGYPVVVDREKEIYFELYGLFGLPNTLLIDQKGNLVAKFAGGVKDPATIREKITPLLSLR